MHKLKKEREIMNKRKLKVVEITEGEYYVGGGTSGSTVDVTLTDGRITLKIEGIMIFDKDEFLLDDFDCAVSLAREGEEGYTIIKE